MKLTAAQERALADTAAAAPAFYWPSGPACVSLRALRSKGLCDFWAGRGWKLTHAGKAEHAKRQGEA